ncbi:hypothetical protein [Actinokineospora sp. HUAS TT18]|uniref:hypothetical protein n=1 Tax=Actinokineospora sp. HUAS TT18 TaxID=3447451 RepID=UPI003F52841C
MFRRAVIGAGIAAVATTTLASGAQAAAYEGALGFQGQSFVGKPGGTVPLDGWCTDPGFTAASISSPVTDPVRIYAQSGEGGKQTFQGTAKIKKSAKEGVYKISFVCGDKKIEAPLTVHVPGPNDKIRVEPGQLKVVPGKAVPGQKVSLWWHGPSCPTPGAATGVRLTGKPGAATAIEDELRVTVAAVVPNGTKPGKHTVTLKCGDTKLSTTLTVVAPAPAKVTVTPKGAPETGGGPVA